MSYAPYASPADVEWVDCHGDTQVYGYQVTTSDIEALEEPGDRRPNGKLTREALHRIAAILSTHLQLLHAQMLAVHGADPDSVVYRDCEGLAPTETNRLGGPGMRLGGPGMQLGWPGMQLGGFERKPLWRQVMAEYRHLPPTKPHLCPTKPESLTHQVASPANQAESLTRFL